MAFRHGKDSEVSINGTLLSAYSDSGTLSIDVDTAETSAFTNDWKTHIVGLAGASLELSGHYDNTVTVGPQAVLIGRILQDPFTCIWYPGGNTTGQFRHTFSAILTGYEESSSVGDKVSFSASLLVTGAITSVII